MSLHLADSAPLSLAAARPTSRRRHPCTPPCSTRSTAATRCSSARSPTRSARSTTPRSPRALWDLVWAGRLTNDTLGPLRPLTGSGRGAHRARRSTPRARYGRPGRAARAGPVRTTHRLGPLVPAARPRDRPHAAGPRAGRRTARPARRRHPRRRHGRAGPRRVRRGLPRARRVRGGRAGPPRLRGRGPRRGPVLLARLPSTGCAPTPRSVASRRPRSCSPRPTRPTPTALPSPGQRARARSPRGTSRAARPERSSSCTTASWSSTSSAAGARSSPGPRNPSTLQPAVDALALAVRDGQLGKLAVERADGVVGPRLPAGPGSGAGRLPPHPPRPAPARLSPTPAEGDVVHATRGVSRTKRHPQRGGRLWIVSSPVVRRAAPADAGAIARIRIAGWRAAYQGLVDAAVLVRLRRGGRHAPLPRPPPPTPRPATYWVSIGSDGQVRGFVCWDPIATRPDLASARSRRCTSTPRPGDPATAARSCSPPSTPPGPTAQPAAQRQGAGLRQRAPAGRSTRGGLTCAATSASSNRCPTPCRRRRRDLRSSKLGPDAPLTDRCPRATPSGSQPSTWTPRSPDRRSDPHRLPGPPAGHHRPVRAPGPRRRGARQAPADPHRAAG